MSQAILERLKEERIPMEIVEFTSDRPKKGRRGSPAIEIGTTLYAIKYLWRKGGYYTFSYQNRTDAEKTIRNMQLHKTDNAYYWEWNVSQNIQDTVHVASREK